MMQVLENEPPAYAQSLLPCNVYAPSLATLASVSSRSVCSDSSSLVSDDSATSYSSDCSSSSDSDSCDSYCLPATASHRQAPCSRQPTCSSPQWKQTVINPAPERKTNSRRTGFGTTTRTGCPPALIRQSDRKVNFVDSLVDSSTQIVETIWPLSSVSYRSETTDRNSKGVLPLRTFIQETLRRSRTSYSTLQVALYYLILVKPHVPSHDFTMEQPDDGHASRVLQCGRRMFLAALILASKYLQDRNFSARAWSKISGLNTHEINQNEIAFLIAVNWKLHIPEDVFQRWTEIVLKYTSHPSPPSPGGSLQPPSLDWKQVIRKLNPQLDNIEGLVSLSPKPKKEVCSLSLRNVLPLPQADYVSPGAPIPRSYSTPLVMEPNPAPVYSTPGRFAPALGLLPTPRLTPQGTTFNTPAVSAASVLLSKSSMSLAMSQVSSAGAAQCLDRWPASTTSSPCYMPARRSSLATISTASSPESMISDSSRTSRSSSISSASSLVSAPTVKLDVQARCRSMKLRNEGYMRPTVIASVSEEYEENCITSSPESYEALVGKDAYDLDDITGATDAARTLQSLHNAYSSNFTPATTPSPTKAGAKRCRTNSVDESVQDSVRDLLRGSFTTEPAWSSNFVYERGFSSHERAIKVPVRGGSKRLCCSAEASQSYARISSFHPAAGGRGGPGMWDGILDD